MLRGTQISLRATRINANMTQSEAAQPLSEYFRMQISRQRVIKYEDNSSKIPPGLVFRFERFIVYQSLQLILFVSQLKII